MLAWHRKRGKHMILYTDEARRSWKQTAQDLKRKVVGISDDQLNVLDASNIITILSMFMEYVDKEAKNG